MTFNPLAEGSNPSRTPTKNYFSLKPFFIRETMLHLYQTLNDYAPNGLIQLES